MLEDGFQTVSALMELKDDWTNKKTDEFPPNLKSIFEEKPSREQEREVQIAYECILNPQIPTHKPELSATHSGTTLSALRSHCLVEENVWKGLRKELQAATSEKLPWNCTGICGRSKRSVLSKWMRSRGLTPTIPTSVQFPRLKSFGFPSDFKFQTSPC